jgi:hypothetical protein
VSGFSRTRVTSSLSRTQLFARLNALAARIYQLSEAEFSHVLATFPLVPHAQRDEALAEFRKAFL